MTEPSISVAVMAHRSRERHIPYLLESLDDQYATRPAEVVWDRHNDRWDTGRRSQLAYDPLATHHLVVQDDALLCRDLVAGLLRAVALVPDHPIGLYTGKVRPAQDTVVRLVDRAQREHNSWIAMQGPWWGVAVLTPTYLIDEMIAWCDQRPEIQNYDRRMSRFYDHIGLECWYSVPSLVDHRVGDGEPSLVPGRGNGDGRTAYRFLGERASACDVAWTATATRQEAAQPHRNTYRVTNTGTQPIERAGRVFHPGPNEMVLLPNQLQQVRTMRVLTIERVTDPAVVSRRLRVRNNKSYPIARANQLFPPGETVEVTVVGDEAERAISSSPYLTVEWL